MRKKTKIMLQFHPITAFVKTYANIKIRRRAKIRYRYNQVPHLTQDTNVVVTNSQLDVTNERQEVSPFPAGGHKALINRRARKHNKHKVEITKEVLPWNGQ